MSKRDTQSAVIYARVSTEEQRHGSIATQIEICRQYCEQKKMDVAQVLVDEAVSGKISILDREGGAQLEPGALSRAGLAHIVLSRLDRLSRDLVDCVTFERACSRAGVSLHFCDQGGVSLDTSTPVGEMQFSMLASFAQLERRIIGERTKEALAYRRHQRKVYSRHAPFGWRKKNGELVADEEEQALIRKMHTLKKRGATIRRIAELCQRKTERKIHPSLVHRILTRGE